MPKSATAAANASRGVFEEIRAFCVANADPGRASRYARYFTEGYDAYGIDHKNPEWMANRRTWAERLRAAGPTAFLDAGDLLFATGKYEEGGMAILIASDLSEFYTPEAFERIGRWFEGGVRNWGHTDVLCGEVLPQFLINGVVGLNSLKSWRDSVWKYKRRAVPVMMIKWLPKQKTNRQLLDLITPLMTDPEKVVQQGTGWFLREMWKRDPKSVEAFLLKHKDTASRVIVQYATEKMTAQQKERFRKTKTKS